MPIEDSEPMSTPNELEGGFASHLKGGTGVPLMGVR